MTLQHATVRIKGTKPLLINQFSEEILSIERKEYTGVAGNDPEEWKRTYSANENGQLYVSSSYIFGSMREAAKYTKNGRGSIQTKLSATFQILSDRIYFDRYIPDTITKKKMNPFI